MLLKKVADLLMYMKLPINHLIGMNLMFLLTSVGMNELMTKVKESYLLKKYNRIGTRRGRRRGIRVRKF
jgi:hypothetical protein